MYSKKMINQFKNLIINEINPNKIILFGSYAYGKPTEISDLDILVIKNEHGKKEFTLKDEAKLNCSIMNKKRDLGLKIRGDIFLMTELQVNEIANMGENSMRDALQKGVVLYANTN